MIDMRAAILESYGAPLRLARIRRPEPFPGEVLLRIDAASIRSTSRSTPAKPPKARTARGKVIIEIATGEHGESLLGEALEEIFPASDPIAPATAV